MDSSGFILYKNFEHAVNIIKHREMQKAKIELLLLIRHDILGLKQVENVEIANVDASTRNPNYFDTKLSSN